MDWFIKIAPIRTKLMWAFGMMTALTLLSILAMALLPKAIGLAVGGIIILASALLGWRLREAIAGPYVSTVVRMEGLAEGDLRSPIEFTDYEDCVGRMTKAMFTFRSTAHEQRESAAEQAEVVQEFTVQLDRVAKGDLTAAVTADFSGEYERLKLNFNAALENLRGLVTSVKESASAIQTGSGEITRASEDLARRTEANAASLEETSTAVGSMNDRMKTMAVAAGQTLISADEAIHRVGAGRDVAEGAVQAMERVSGSAQGIDDVIEGVDKIAFQTRVLAMNAAVEAGRAGEAGRGFAVVADLVSALAMRAEEEAKRARDQLTVTQKEIGSAVEAVKSVDTALMGIVDGINNVHGLIGQMAQDNQAQSSAIGEITAAVNTMDQATQQNAAMVEQTSVAARNLDNEVARLSEQASRFHVSSAPHQPAASRPAERQLQAV